VDEEGRLIHKVYLRTEGRPIEALRRSMAAVRRDLDVDRLRVAGAGATGSGRRLAGALLGADIVKNEITAHAVAAHWCVPGVRCVLEIGGQDSKIILMEDGVVRDFAMNTVCAAGTGSFLDRQAARLNIPIEEFGRLAAAASSPVRIAGRCAVFAESDMIHKQQAGYAAADIVAGLCEALVRNYMNNLAKGKQIRPPVVFQGGVAANLGMAEAFRRELGQPVIVPEHHDVMGALGVALLAREAQRRTRRESRFAGFGWADHQYMTDGMVCSGCDNRCELARIFMDGREIARWGGRCGRWDSRPDAPGADARGEIEY
jgi:predicted CoA-substrate-specific enzyme activase